MLALNNNNPGNVSLPISNYTGPGSIVGAPGQSGYASFPDVASGLQALDTQLTNRISQGYNTIASLNPVYAQDPNWKNNVSQFSGIDINAPLDLSNSTQMSALQYGIIQAETGNASAFGISPSSPFGASDASGVAPGNASGSDPLGVFPLGGSSATGGATGAGASSSAPPAGASAAQTSNWLEEIFANTKNLFQRGIIGLAGIVLLLGALMYLALSKRSEAAS